MIFPRSLNSQGVGLKFEHRSFVLRPLLFPPSPLGYSLSSVTVIAISGVFLNPVNDSWGSFPLSLLQKSHCCYFSPLAPWGFYPTVLLHGSASSSFFFIQLCWFLLGSHGHVLTRFPNLHSTPCKQPRKRGASLGWDQTGLCFRIF